MQYYNEFVDNSLLIDKEFGKLEYEDNNYYVNGKEINNNRGITNDIVYIENNNVISIKERNNKFFIGILYINSKTKYGCVNGKNKYLFKPLNKKFSNFFVTSKHKNEQNMYVKIEFKDWDKKDKIPNGVILEYLGYVGNIDAEYEALRYYYDLYKPPMKIKKDKIDSDLATLSEIIEFEYEIFSIDPEGSLDIDDAFHFHKMSDYHNDNTNVVKYEIGIHIAYPTYFLFDYIEEIMSRVSTIYLPNKKYPMLPNIYSDNILSLIENNKRIALSIIYTFDEKLNLENFKIKESNVINIKNYTYENFDLMLTKKSKLLNNVERNIIEFFNISKTIFNLDTMDSHLFVEKWMIKSNHTIAKYLIKHNLKNVIIRTQKTPILCSNFNLEHDENENDNQYNEELIKYINIKNEESAKYEIYDLENTNNSDTFAHAHTRTQTNHYRLNLDYYTHFTSPIRRAIDFYIHSFFLGKRNIFDKEKLTNIVNNINTFTKNQRKFQRQIKRLEFLSTIKDNVIITTGYIIDILDRYIIIYIPEYKLEEKICIIQKKFEKIIKSNIELNENGEIETINVINESDNEINSYNLYEKLTIKLYVFLSFDNIFDKLKIEIVKK
jgi:ribonuclease R